METISMEYLYGNYKYGILVWKLLVWNPSMEISHLMYELLVRKLT